MAKHKKDLKKEEKPKMTEAAMAAIRQNTAIQIKTAQIQADRTHSLSEMKRRGATEEELKELRSFFA